MARKRAYPVEEPVLASSSKGEEIKSNDSGEVKSPPPKLHKSLSRNVSDKKKKKKKKKKQRLRPSNKPLCSSASEEQMNHLENSEGAKDKEGSDEEAEGTQVKECSDEEAEGRQEKERSDEEAEGSQFKECSDEEAEGTQEKERSNEEAEAQVKECSDEEAEGPKDKECSDEEAEGAKGKGCSDEESEEKQSFSEGLGKSDNPVSHNASEENMKMVSKDADEEREESRRNPFQRVWSDDDVIALLQGVIDYTSKEGKTPSEDRAAFGSFINAFISFDATKVQVSEKIRRLKEKYENNVLRGKNKIFETTHDQKVFELSEKIWGREGVIPKEAQDYSLGSHRKSKMVRRVNDEPAENGNNDKTDMLKMIEVHKQLAGHNIDSSFIKKGLDMIDHAKKAELEDKWQKLEIEEWELYEKRLGLIREQGFCILEAMKSG